MCKTQSMKARKSESSDWQLWLSLSSRLWTCLLLPSGCTQWVQCYHLAEDLQPQSLWEAPFSLRETQSSVNFRNGELGVAIHHCSVASPFKDCLPKLQFDLC